MKKSLISVFTMGLLLLTACSKSDSGTVFKGESENWTAELITAYDFWGNETQSLRIQYKGRHLDQHQENYYIVESSDFWGWGIQGELNQEGIYNSGEVAKLETKTPTSSTIQLKIEGIEPETIILCSDSF